MIEYNINIYFYKNDLNLNTLTSKVVRYHQDF